LARPAGAGIQARSGAAGETKLDRRQAHIIHRWVVEGWSADEIAAETRLEVGYIYFLKYRALKKLREYCAGE
jgi:DNA-directed RNA polymerase specialized sigma24 family protein